MRRFSPPASQPPVPAAGCRHEDHRASHAARHPRRPGHRPPRPRRRADPAAAWSDTLTAATNGRVYWNAWGGDDTTNAFIAWAADRLKADHNIDVRHVRLRDTSEAVARVVAEKAAGRTEGGSVDLIWINGPNFLSMKQQGLLYGPVARSAAQRGADRHAPASPPR